MTEGRAEQMGEQLVSHRPGVTPAAERVQSQRLCVQAIQRASLRALLVTTSLYLILGNVPRLVALPPFRHNLNVAEFVLFAVSVGVGILNPTSVRFFTIRWFPVWWAVVLSCTWGILLNGFSISPVLYAVRMILLLFASALCGYALYRRHGADYPAVLKYLVRTFLFVAAAGVAMYVIFPDLRVLWPLLKEMGVVFLGDPHQRRLVSTYFDPNFYSIIASFYITASFVLWEREGKAAWALTFGFLLMTVLMAASRTGFGTLVLTLLAIAWQRRERIVALARVLRVRKGTARSAGLLGSLLILGAPLYIDRLLKTIEMLRIMDRELSALSRLESWEVGAALFWEHPWAGMGYNYLSPRLQATWGPTGLCSAIQTTFLNFGIPLTLLLVVVGVSWAVTTGRRLARQGEHARGLSTLYWLFLVHIAVVLFFSSQFNNAFYFTFWQVPVATLGAYLTLLAREAPRSE